MQRLKFLPRLAIPLFLCVAAAVSVPAQVDAFAAPVFYVAATNSCSLPDGTSGYLRTDGHTCCPANANSDTACLFAKYINPAVQLLSAAVGVAVVASIIYGAIEFTTSAGDPGRATSGRKRIVNSLIGLAVFLLLYSFLQFVIPGGLLNG